MLIEKFSLQIEAAKSDFRVRTAGQTMPSNQDPNLNFLKNIAKARQALDDQAAEALEGTADWAAEALRQVQRFTAFRAAVQGLDSLRAHYAEQPEVVEVIDRASTLVCEEDAERRATQPVTYRL